VVTAQYGLPRLAYPEPVARLAAHERVIERVRATPGVTAVGLSMALPFGEGLDSSPFAILGRAPAAGGAQPHAEYNIVSEDWFRAMGIVLRRGRSFTSADALGAPPVVLVDEQLAREFFPGEDPVGRRIRQNGEAEIVGVVASVARAQLGEKRKALIYYPLRQSPIGAVAVAVRGALPPSGAGRVLRAAVAEVDRQVPVYDVRAMQERVDDSVGARRLATATFGAFAAVALVLAALGVYGVLSYVTAQRTRELGVRAAFGARGADLERMVLAGGARLAAAGVAGGALLFLALRRGLSALLYGVGPTDPVALGAGVTALAAVVLLASWLPARRAARADPAQALRAE
jgi:putative ABC transport system permease protein